MKLRKHKIDQSHRILAIEELLRKFVPQSVFEVGSGDFSFRYAIAHFTPDWQTLDFNEGADIICDLNDEKLCLPVPDNTYELVLCGEVLEHLLWPHRLLTEIHRILLPHGIVIISVPNITSLTYRIAWLFGHLPSCAARGNLPRKLGSCAYVDEDGRLIGGHVCDFTPKLLEQLVSHCGFRIVCKKSSGIWRIRQVLPRWIVPPTLSTNLIFACQKV
jgi:SAM-dependent methyltransferase